MIEKSKFLGFYPESAEGFMVESNKQPFSPQELPIALNYLNSLLEKKYHCVDKIPVSLRRKLLDHLLDFYAQHMENPSIFKSLAVIRQVME
jgi:DNA repair protein RecO (recombination protein O)